MICILSELNLNIHLLLRAKVRNNKETLFFFFYFVIIWVLKKVFI